MLADRARQIHGAWQTIKVLLISHGASLLILVLGVCVTFTVCHYTQISEAQQVSQAFLQQNKVVSDSFERRFSTYHLLLESAAATVQASGEALESDFFSHYASALNFQRDYAGVIAVGSARRQPGEPFLRVRAVSSQIPALASGARLVSAELRQAMLGEQPMLGEMLQVEDVVPQLAGVDFVLFYPVMNPGSTDISQARDYVFALVSMRDLMRGVIGDSPEDIDLRVIRKAGLGQTDLVLYELADRFRARNGRYQQQLGVLLGGKVWLLDLQSTESFEQANTRMTASVILYCGLVLSLMLSAFVWHLMNLRQIAEQRASEMTKELRQSEERFALAMAAAQDGIWERMLVSGETYLSPHVSEMLGYRSDENMPAFDSLVHPNDRMAWAEFLRKLPAKAERVSLELRLRHKARRWVWMRVMALVVEGQEGEAERFVGSLSDITDAHDSKEALIRSRDELQTLVGMRTRELRLAKEAAERANEAKTQFLSNMSHELRTPMHAILSFARLGIQRLDTAEKARIHRYFSSILESGERLLNLLNDLLDLSRMEAGKMPLELNRNDIALIAQQVVGEMEPLSEARSILIQMDVIARHTELVCDAQRISQVVRNLLSNAIKFSPPGSSIQVVLEDVAAPEDRIPLGDATAAPSCIALSVMDYGCGIPEAERECVFDKYVQSSKTRSTAGGTGLGLSICREIVSAHGGHISANNRPEGGACLRVLLPVV